MCFPFPTLGTFLPVSKQMQRLPHWWDLQCLLSERLAVNFHMHMPYALLYDILKDGGRMIAVSLSVCLSVCYIITCHTAAILPKSFILLCFTFLIFILLLCLFTVSTCVCHNVMQVRGQLRRSRFSPLSHVIPGTQNSGYQSGLVVGTFIWGAISLARFS